jgi:flagellar hook assembly protein FlgD
VVEVTWDGTDDAGEPLPDGVYTLRAEATSSAGAARAATGTVRLDTVAPRVGSVKVSPDPFSPNGDGRSDVTRLAYTPAESVQSRVSVGGDDGSVLRRLSPWTYVTAAAHKVKWDGRIKSGSVLVAAPEGTATLQLEIRDTAGNTTTVQRRVVLDRTLALTGVSRTTFSPNGDGVADAATLSFKLTRAADVTAAVVSNGAVVRALALGRLAAGRHAVTWGGELDGDGSASSGRYTLRLTADGAVGVTSAGQALTVDLAAPRLSAPATVRAAYRTRARLPYTVRDADSATVKVTATVTSARWGTVARIALGWVKQGTRHICVWKPRKRGTYTVRFRAVDAGGNRARASVRTVLKVR